MVMGSEKLYSSSSSAALSPSCLASSPSSPPLASFPAITRPSFLSLLPSGELRFFRLGFAVCGNNATGPGWSASLKPTTLLKGVSCRTSATLFTENVSEAEVLSLDVLEIHIASRVRHSASLRLNIMQLRTNCQVVDHVVPGSSVIADHSLAITLPVSDTDRLRCFGPMNTHGHRSRRGAFPQGHNPSFVPPPFSRVKFDAKSTCTLRGHRSGLCRCPPSFPRGSFPSWSPSSFYASSTRAASGPWRWIPLGVDVSCTILAQGPRVGEERGGSH